MCSNLALPFAQDRFRQNTEHFIPIRQAYLTDAQTGWFSLQNHAQASGWHRPDFHRDLCPSTFAHPIHAWVTIPDGKKPVGCLGLILADKFRPHREQIAIQLQPAHEGPVDGKVNHGSRRLLTGGIKIDIAQRASVAASCPVISFHGAVIARINSCESDTAPNTPPCILIIFNAAR